MLAMFFVLLGVSSIFSTLVVYCALINAARINRMHELQRVAIIPSAGGKMTRPINAKEPVIMTGSPTNPQTIGVGV